MLLISLHIIIVITLNILSQKKLKWENVEHACDAELSIIIIFIPLPLRNLISVFIFFAVFTSKNDKLFYGASKWWKNCFNFLSISSFFSTNHLRVPKSINLSQRAASENGGREMEEAKTSLLHFDAPWFARNFSNINLIIIVFIISISVHLLPKEQNIDLVLPLKGIHL